MNADVARLGAPGRRTAGGAPAPVPPFTRLERLADRFGLVEHAELERPRRELGCCADDAGRLLAVAARWPADPAAEALAGLALDFLTRAQLPGGGFRLRCSGSGSWTDDPPSDDATARALYGLGTAAGCAPWPPVRRRALVLFEASAGFRSEHPRPTAHAALGAFELIAATPPVPGAIELVEAATGLLDAAPSSGPWQWPAARLTYANALLPEAQLAAGVAVGDPGAVRRALRVLRWLVETESRGPWFSFTPVAGRGPGDPKPGFDQQPIEAWAMVDACARAFDVTGDPYWERAAQRAARWFLGRNDSRVPVFDHATSGGFDGLRSDGVNLNQGAESTLAYLGSMLRVAELAQSRAGATSARAASR